MTFSKLGDLYIINGKHRLLCGDSTKLESIKLVLNGSEIDLGVTDPPYNIAYNSLDKNYKDIQNDNMDDLNFRKFLTDSLKYLPYQNYVFCNWKSYHNFWIALNEIKKPPKACLVWDKEIGVQNLDKYFKQHEFVLYTGKFGGEKTLSGDVFRYKREVQLKDGGEFHPTPKPVNLIVRLLEDNPETINVLDLFAGSGSTLIACERTDKTSFNIELDPDYIDNILRRFFDHTIGCSYELIRDNKTYKMDQLINELKLDQEFKKGKITAQTRLII